jgi:hypothetical protein
MLVGLTMVRITSHHTLRRMILMGRKELTSKPMRHYSDNRNRRVYHMVDQPDGGLNIEEVSNMTRSKSDRAAEVVGRVTGKSIVAMENAATTTGKWIRNTGAPATIKAGKGVGRFLSKFASEVKAEVRAAKDDAIDTHTDEEVM